MDIEEFYDEDPRRRSSAEVKLGRDWHDAHGVRYELSWIEDTGELYAMREPVPAGWATPFGGIHVSQAHSADADEIAGMTVGVLGLIPTRAELESTLSGWEDAMSRPNSIDWFAGRLRQAGLLAAAPAAVTAPGPTGSAATA